MCGHNVEPLLIMFQEKAVSFRKGVVYGTIVARNTVNVLETRGREVEQLVFGPPYGSRRADDSVAGEMDRAVEI